MFISTLSSRASLGLRLAPIVIAWLAVILVLSTPVQAQAANLVSCTGTETVSFAPGLTNTPHPLTVTTADNFPVCIHASAPILMPATAQAQISRTASCLDLLGGGPGTRVLHWANGQTSTYSFVSSANVVNGNIVTVSTGTITDGLYKGASATGNVVLTPLLANGTLNLNDTCNSAQGMISASGTYIFNVLPL